MDNAHGLDRRCYWAGPKRVRVYVEAGRVDLVVNRQTGDRIEAAQRLREYPTIDALFVLISDIMWRNTRML